MVIRRWMRQMLIALAVVSGSSLFHVAEAQEIRIKWSHALPVTGTMGVGATMFADEVNSRLAGRVKIEVYPAAQLYKSLDGINALRRGDVQIVHEGSSYLPSLTPEWEVFELPFLFDSWEHAWAAVDGPVGQQVSKRLEAKGIKVVANFALAFYEVANSKRPVKTMQDLRGLKIRALGRTSEAAFKALGASTVSIAASEIYTALSSGVMDGVFISPVSIVDRKLYEVQKYLTLSQQSFIFLPVMVNAKFWDGLPPATRTELQAIMKDVEKKQRRQALDDADRYIARLKAAGMEIYQLPKAERENWRKAVAPVYDMVAKEIGPELIKQAREAR
jgi:C4-dicarboxylate-binding protein DctP